MKTYKLWAEYGPLAIDKIEWTTSAESKKQAKTKFIEYLKKYHKNLYEIKIGFYNIYIGEK